MKNNSIHELINNQSLYRIKEDTATYNSKVLDESNYIEHIENLQLYLSKQHASELAGLISEKAYANRVKSLIRKYLTDNTVIKGFDFEELVNRLYDDIAGYAFINKYLYDEDIEEINGNAWNDIEIVYKGGWHKVSETFTSPQHAIDIVRKMMRAGGATLDEKKPVGESYLTTGIRISAMIPPVIDFEIGTVFSIRKQKNLLLTKEDLIDMNTCTNEEFGFLQACLSHGISLGIAGATSSGKTTNIISLLSSLDDKKRIYIIEDTREISLNPVLNNKVNNKRVIYTKTRYSKDIERNITASSLLKSAMRYHPDIIVPAEMRDEVALVAVEAGRTGHTILAGLHANSAVEAYDRILTMCMMAGSKLSEQLLMKLIISAFPIMVFVAQLPDDTRKVMQIYEAYSYNNLTSKVEGKVIYSFEVYDNTVDTQNKIKILGKHRMKNRISDDLANKMLVNGCDMQSIRRYANDEWEPKQ